MQEKLSSWVYLERKSPFCLPKIRKDRVVRLDSLVRAVGVVEGVIKKFDLMTSTGTIEIEGSTFLFEAKNKKIISTIGKPASFSFWPTVEEKPEKLTKRKLKLSVLKLARVRKANISPSGCVEVVGKLEEISSMGFVVAVWSKRLQRFFYVIFAGKYPYPDEVGKFVWITGKFDPKAGWLYCEETSVLAFVPTKEN